MEPWVSELQRGSAEAAWDLFLGRYRRVIFGAIRRVVRDADDVMDVFARVCETLREDDFARFRRCAERYDPARPFSTWLVAVVRNLAIDWLRHRDGRPRLSAAAAALPELQQRIFTAVFVEQRSHVETFELLRSHGHPDLGFRDFQRELRDTYRRVAAARGGKVLVERAVPVHEETDHADPAVLADRRAVLADAMACLSPEDRLAVQLYVVDGMPADQVARALGYTGPKTVYNHVYRALATVREWLARGGIRGGDL